jgi:hypothetical protein
MQWVLSRLWAIFKSNWPLAIIAGVAAVVALYFGQGLVFFSAALVVVTLALALSTEGLARANRNLADHQWRTEVRSALKAAKDFIEIKPDDFVRVLDGRSIPHSETDAIDELAAYSNYFKDPITVRDIHGMAARIDNVKIADATITAEDARDMLTKLQQRIVAEIPKLRLKIRDWTKELS